MKKISVLLLILLCCGFTNAQKTKNIVKINSGEILQNGIKLYDQGSYSDALAQYHKIPYGDTSYSNAQYEIALTEIAMEDYKSAAEICQKLLEDPSCTVPIYQIYTNLGSCYDYMEQYDKAIAVFDKAIQHDQYKYLLYFNRGIVYMRLKKYDEAMQDFTHAIFLFPAHQGSHYYYGLCCLQSGYTVPGILALNYATLINPSSSYTINALKELNGLYNTGINTYNKDNEITISPEIEKKNELYQNIMLALNSTLASNSEFKNKSKINHIIVKSNQIVFSNIKTRPNSYTIEDQLYAPFFSQIMTDKKFNIFSYYELSNTNIDNGAVSKKANKMGADMDKFIQFILQNLKIASSKGLGTPNQEGFYYVYSQDFRLSKWGKIHDAEHNNFDKEGEWNELDDSKLTQCYYKDNIQNGPYKIYNYGVLIASFNLKQGAPDGMGYQYSIATNDKDSILTASAMLANGKQNGQRKFYNNSGILTEESSLNDSYFDGEVRRYDDQGHLSDIQHYTSGNEDGQQQSFFANGQLQRDYTVGKKGEKTSYMDYYATGKINAEGTIKDGNRVDTWKYYYANGVLSELYHFNDEGKMDGEQLRYYRNHNLIVKSVYNNGKLQQYTEYDHNGKPLIDYAFKNGSLVTVTTLYSDSTVREAFPVKNNRVTYDYYNEYGVHTTTVTMDGKFQKQGHQTYYYPNGQLRRDAYYVDDQLDGITKIYYDDGNLKSYIEYKHDQCNGYNINYYDTENGIIENESVYHNDTLIGPYYKYYTDGNTEEIDVFNSNGTIIHKAKYLPDGKKYQETFYKNELPYVQVSYNLEGNVTHRDTIENGNGLSKEYYLDGRIYTQCRVLGSSKIDTCTCYSYNGKILSKTNYIDGSINGTLNYYAAFDELNYYGNCILGNQEGKWSYYEDGILAVEKYFENGIAEDLSKFYYYNGALFCEINNESDQITGKRTTYAPDGKTIIYELYNDADNTNMYAYMQKDGTMSKPAPLGNKPLQITCYYPNGQTSAVINYDKGILNGMRTIYYPNGQAAQSDNFKDGMHDGIETAYYPNGKTRESCTYLTDCLNGPKTIYYENGKIEREVNYYYDMLHGDCKKYDKSGKLVHKVTYYYDNVTDDVSY